MNPFGKNFIGDYWEIQLFFKQAVDGSVVLNEVGLVQILVEKFNTVHLQLSSRSALRWQCEPTVQHTSGAVVHRRSGPSHGLGACRS